MPRCSTPLSSTPASTGCREVRGTAGNYGTKVLGAYADRLSSLDREAYVYFNNDMAGNAVRNALALMARLSLR